jgi:hypothetical protein
LLSKGGTSGVAGKRADKFVDKVVVRKRELKAKAMAMREAVRASTTGRAIATTGATPPGAVSSVPVWAAPAARRLPASSTRHLATSEVEAGCAAKVSEEAALTTTSVAMATSLGNMVCTNNRPKKDGDETYGGLLVKNNEAVELTLRLSVRLRLGASRKAKAGGNTGRRMTTLAGNSSSSKPVLLARFRARLCPAAPADGGTVECVLSDELACFNDVVKLPPGASIAFPPMTGAGYAREAPLSWQSMRDNTMGYKPSGIAKAADQSDGDDDDEGKASTGVASGSAARRLHAVRARILQSKLDPVQVSQPLIAGVHTQANAAVAPALYQLYNGSLTALVPGQRHALCRRGRLQQLQPKRRRGCAADAGEPSPPVGTLITV